MVMALSANRSRPLSTVTYGDDLTGAKFSHNLTRHHSIKVLREQRPNDLWMVCRSRPISRQFQYVLSTVSNEQTAVWTWHGCVISVRLDIDGDTATLCRRSLTEKVEISTDTSQKCHMPSKRNRPDRNDRLERRIILSEPNF
jgi:hypothetical protein